MINIPEPTSIVLAVSGATLFGLLSVPHCAGMCGPLHLSVCLMGGKRFLPVMTFFNLGRLAGYTLIGLVCGFMGEQLADAFPTPSNQVAHSPTCPMGQPVQTSQENESGTIEVPLSCCEAAGAEDASTSCRACAVSEGGHGHAKSLWRRGLMLLFPAAILLLTGFKSLRAKAAGTGDGLSARLFARFQKSSPLALGLAASLLPCGMLYYAFAVAVGTLSPILGGTFLFTYCLTISFFLQLGIVAGTTFGKRLGPVVNRAFPWLALGGAGVYTILFFMG